MLILNSSSYYEKANDAQSRPFAVRVAFKGNDLSVGIKTVRMKSSFAAVVIQ